jgi:hypothetical protein
MYTHINTLCKLTPEADEFIINNDRMLFAPFFKAAEEFCAAHQVLIGGRVGIDLLIGAPLTKKSFYWELFCDNTFGVAKELAQKLADVNSPHIPARTVAMRTEIKNAEFIIAINARILFKLYALRRYKGVDLYTLITPSLRKSYLSDIDINCINESMQLIDIYRDLYSPAKFDTWQYDLRAEPILFDALGSHAQITGGSKFIPKKDICADIARKLPGVLIGEFALVSLGLSSTQPIRVQLISDDTIENIRLAVVRLLENDFRNVHIASHEVTYIEYPLNLPNDFQITKHTIYIDNGKDKLPILDVFNSTCYELIPYSEAKADGKPVKIANPWVIMRFLFIDIWILKLVTALGTKMTDKISHLLTQAASLRKHIYDDLPATFQLNNYAGVYTNEAVAKKKMIKDVGQKFPTYYPVRSEHVSRADPARERS